MTELHDCHVIDWRIMAVHGTLIGERRHPANNDHNNCTVRALVDCFGLHLIHAYEHNKAHGRRHRCAMRNSHWKRAALDMAKQRGLYMRRLGAIKAQREYGKTVRTAQRAVLPHQRVIFNQPRHTMGWANGVTSDWADGRRKHIQGVWEFLPREAA